MYANAAHLYSTIETLFDRLQKEDPGAANAVLRSRLIIRLYCRDLDAHIIINGRKKPLQTVYGRARIRPDLDITLSSDTLHQILLGQLPLSQAIAGKRITVKGPIWKSLPLSELFHRGQNIYPQIMEDMNGN